MQLRWGSRLFCQQLGIFFIPSKYKRRPNSILLYHCNLWKQQKIGLSASKSIWLKGSTVAQVKHCQFVIFHKTQLSDAIVVGRALHVVAKLALLKSATIFTSTTRKRAQKGKAYLAPTRSLLEAITNLFWCFSNGKVFLHISAVPAKLLQLHSKGKIFCQGPGGWAASLQESIGPDLHHQVSIQEDAHEVPKMLMREIWATLRNAVCLS